MLALHPRSDDIPRLTEDPYSPPKAKLDDSGDAPRGSLPRAILTGLAVDIGGTLATLAMVSIALGILFNREAEVLAQIADSPWFKAVMTTLGFGFTVLGGYVAARIANYIELNVSLAFGACSLVCGELLGVWLGGDQSAFEHVVFLLLTIPAALLGGWLRKRQRRATASDYESPLP